MDLVDLPPRLLIAYGLIGLIVTGLAVAFFAMRIRSRAYQRRMRTGDYGARRWWEQR